MDLLNKYLLCYWKNGDYEERWLRRVNRKTSTQFISDVQRFLNVKRVKSNEFIYSINNHCAKRFYVKNNEIRMRGIQNFNPKGKMSISVIEDFNDLDLDYSFDDFKNDISQLPDYMDDNGRVNVFITKGKPEDYEKNVFKHIKMLFGDDIEIYTVLDIFGNINTTHGDNRLAYTSTKYHITTNGNNKKSITTIENKSNVTICFWKFGDKIVWKYESGIGTW